MTTTTYRRGSKYGKEILIESIQAYDDNVDYESALQLVKEIAYEANRHLPSSYAWYPLVSEVYVAIDETEELTDEQFDEICRKAFETVMSEREEEV